jgi:hypothetical protein
MKTLITFFNKLHVNYDTFETRAHDEQDKDLFTQSTRILSMMIYGVLSETCLDVPGLRECG